MDTATLWQIICLVLGAGLFVAAVLLLHQRRLMASLQQQQQQLQTRLGQVSDRPNVFGHEVRTPLALISGAAELLAEQSPGPLNDRQLEFVRTIATNVRQVIGMANDVLVDSKIDSDIFVLRQQEVDLRVLVRQCVREVRRINQTTLVLVDQGPPLIVSADPDLMRQALWNLVNNAVRHCGSEDPITVEVTHAGLRAVVQVSDQGRGMDDNEIAAVFEPHTVGNSPRPGSGLGLSITQRIVERHGGQVLIDSSPGLGTSVVISLPMKASSNEVQHAEMSEAR